MIAALGVPDVRSPTPMRGRIVAIATAAGWLVLTAAIGRSYFGHSRSPYGVCYDRAGRSVPCAVRPTRMWEARR